MAGALLIYAANGYTGELTARFAAERKQQAIVAGRSAERVRAVADRYGFDHRVFGLDDPEALVAGLAGVGVVLHCAGPFSRTSKPMIDACLAAPAHYLDITGEIAVFESAAARDADARSAGVMLLPGTGFDVVPSDCLALHVARKLPDAHELTLGFSASARSLTARPRRWSKTCTAAASFGGTASSRRCPPDRSCATSTSGTARARSARCHPVGRRLDRFP